MRGSGSPRRGLPKGLPKRSRQLIHSGDVGAVLGHGRERPGVIDLLISVAVLPDLRLPSGQRDNGRAAQIRVLQARRQVQRAHRLRAAHSHLAANPGVAVGHVGRALLAVRHYPGYSKPLQLGHGLRHANRHEKVVRHTVAVQHLGQKTRAAHHRHSGHSPRSRRPRLIRGVLSHLASRHNIRPPPPGCQLARVRLNRSHY